MHKSNFQDVIEEIEKLSPEDQIILVDIIHQRLIEFRKKEISDEIAEAREYYRTGNVKRGNVEELIREIDD
jgi:hypothetical protein